MLEKGVVDMRFGGSLLQTSNPALRRSEPWQEGRSAGGTGVATIQGVVNKTAMLAAICVAGGMLGLWIVQNRPALALPLGVAGLVATIVVYFMIFSNPLRARYTAWVYALVQGAFLGVLTDSLDRVLLAQGVTVTGGLALQAFVITFSILIAMLALYYFRVLKPTRMFVSVVSVLTLGIFVTYLVSFIMSMFGTQMPFISLGSAMEGGQAAWIGLGINALILGVASLWLIIDFGMVEQQVRAGAPRAMEWFCGFALMVTLVWIYLEAVKLVFRIAMLMNQRD
jgi:uncharacterized YccA/Bax inhibitor family protein